MKRLLIAMIWLFGPAGFAGAQAPVSAQLAQQTPATAANTCATCPHLTRDNVVLTIKDQAWVDELRDKLKANPLIEPFAEDLLVVYAINEQDRIGYVMTGEEKALGLDRKQLRALALKNLRRILPKIQLAQMPPTPILVMSAGGDYDASLLLLDDIWSGDQIKSKVEGDIVVAVPARDALLITGSRSRKGVAALRKVATEQVEKASHPLTATLFVYRDGEFKRYGKKPKSKE